MADNLTVLTKSLEWQMPMKLQSGVPLGRMNGEWWVGREWVMRKRPGEGSFLVCGSYAQSTKNKKATDAKKLS